MSKIPYEDRAKVYDDAAILYGRDCQMVVAVEELAECIKEITKALRHNVRPAALAEEVADALIVLEQVKRMFKIEDCVKEFMDTKIKRLSERIAKDFPWEGGPA